MENEENKLMEQGKKEVLGFNDIGRTSNTATQIITNIQDPKKIFNLENKVDNLLNDCEGELIRVKEVLIRRYEKPLKEPVFDDNTGEIIKESDVTMSCVIVDDNDISYATGSKIFTIQLLKYLENRKLYSNEEGMFEIKIIKKKFGDNGNKALSFELI